VGGDTLAVQNDLDATEFLVAEDVVELVLVGQDTQTLGVEVVQVVEVEGRRCRGAAPVRRRHGWRSRRRTREISARELQERRPVGSGRVPSSMLPEGDVAIG